MDSSKLSVTSGATRLDGLLMSSGAEDTRPLVLVFPTFHGRTDADLVTGERLGEAGYRSIACDLYGDGRSGSTRDEATALMRPLLDDRGELRRRVLAWFAEACRLSGSNGSRVAAIGFCFGGLCPLDLARSGAAIAGVASFHGLFTPAADVSVEPIRAKVVAFHGWDDPMVPPEQVTALGKELTEAGADWQIHAYGGTMHGFTNPAAASPETGVHYNSTAARRAWTSLFDFLGEIFG